MNRGKLAAVLDSVGRFMATGGYSLLEPPPPEPVYEYRVVCADGRTVGKVPLDRIRAEALARSANTWHPTGRAHAHTVERRSVGPWEAT